MIAYTSRTGYKEKLTALRAVGWRLFISAVDLVVPYDGFQYAIDNGAWTSHIKGVPWSEAKFIHAIEKIGDGADFIVAPDIVAGGVKSLELTCSWLERLERYPLVLVPVQNGMEPDHVRDLVGRRVGIFLGGDDNYKLSTMRQWGTFAREAGCYYHVGRVNSMKRIWMCGEAGADSFDGSGASRYPGNLERAERARRQGCLVFDE